MSKGRKIQKILHNGDPAEYDLVIGPRKETAVFSESRNFENRLEVPVYTQRVNEVVRRGFYWTKHVRYPFLALELMLEGEMEFQTEDRLEIAGPGSLYVIPPGTTVKFRCRDGKELRKLAVIMGGDNLKGIMIALHLPGCRLLHPSEPEALEGKMRELKDAVTAEPLDNSARSYCFLMELAALAAIEENRDSAPLIRAVAIMESNFQENLHHLPPSCPRQSLQSPHRYVLVTENKGCARCGT